MKETSYYELKMPDSNDTIDVSVLNNNMKRLDDVLILTVIGRTAETSEFVKKCCAPYIMIQNLGEETVTIYDRRWPEDMWEDNKIVIEPTKFYIYRVANSVNANFLVLDNKECNFRYFITAEQAIAEGGGGGGGGTTDYNELDNQPKVNGIVLVGNKSFKELGLLNDDGKIKSDYLPPFVDNMDSYDTEADFPRPGVEDRLYLDKSTNLAYIWTGTDYACIGTPLALGITHETAGYGDESRAAYNHSLSEHARVDATKTEASNVNGKIKINETDVDVYTHPQAEGKEATNPHGTTASDVGLGNLLNAKQVTVTEQAYSDTEKAQARNNIGAGTSSFSGKYSDLAEIPSEFTPAEHNHDDLYAHKTSVSSANKTTSTIAITDNSQMVMVAKISGKTVKDGTTLKSAAVESVVSRGKNLCDGKLIDVYPNDVSLEVLDNSDTSYSTIIPCKPNTTYTISKNGGNRMRICTFDKYPALHAFGKRMLINDMTATTNVFTFTTNSDETYVLAYLGLNSSMPTNIQMELGNTATEYVPYTDKTTVLVPSSVKNLPDYGCSVGDIANEIDFENGVYYHRVAKSVPLNWQLTSGYFFTSTLTNKKNGDSNFIHPLLSIGGLNVGAAEIPSGCARGNTSSYNIYARDTSITTAAAFNEKYGVPVIYELATTEVIPLADYLRPLPVEVGGTITLVNPYNLDVNSTIKYKKEVN